MPSRRGFRALAAARRAPAAPVTAGVLLGALLLVVSEFTTLYFLHLTTSILPVGTVSVGAHDSYALIPIALLAAGLGLLNARRPSRPALLAITALGAIALLITLFGDLPDTHARGISHELTLASTTAGTGLYLEALGAIVLLAAGGLGALAAFDVGLEPPSRRRRRRPPAGEALDGRSGY